MKQPGIFHEWTNNEYTYDNKQGIMNSETSNNILGGGNKRWTRGKKKMLKEKNIFEISWVQNFSWLDACCTDPENFQTLV